MFLIPALIAATCDWVILYLTNKFPDHHGEHWYLSFGYLSYVAGCRLVTLFPLSYHTSTGTRLKFPWLYYTLHMISGMVMVLQMIQLGMSNPGGGWWSPTLAPGPVIPSSSFLPRRFLRELTTVLHSNATTTTTDNDNEEEDSSEVKMIWILLTLSVTSLSLHVLILLHVRSSAPAPTHSRYRELHNKKHLAYFVISRFNQQQPQPTTTNNNNNNSTANTSLASAAATFLLQSKQQQHNPELSSLLCDNSHDGHEHPLNDDIDDDDDEEEKKMTCDNNKGRPPLPPQRHNSFTGAFMSNYDEFMADLQVRFEEAKHQWGLRLEEVHKRLQQNHASTTNAWMPHYAHNTPFRALLQLYAYEEVFSNHQLEGAFGHSSDLTFYAPQLLSFLLHGAFLNSIELESWILQKCQTNLHFAHQCYWFLKAWCSLAPPTIEIHHNNNNKEEDDLELGQTTSNSNSKNNTTRRSASEPDLRSGSSPLILTDSIHTSTDKQKYGVEEHIVIERLVLKILELGAEAATQLEYGTPHPSSVNLSELLEPNPVFNPTNTNGFIPVDPITGLPSPKHLLAVHSHPSSYSTTSQQHQQQQQYGFLPYSKYPSVPLTPLEKSQLFLQTPNFIDALLKMADELFLLPKSKRTVALREQLRNLEMKYLPSNVLYLPVNNSMHRVWRIVASESIALSTKERVPCIVCFEVIDYNHHHHHHTDNHYQDSTNSNHHHLNSHYTNTDYNNNNNNNNMHSQNHKSKKNDSTSILTNWYKNPRPPQRHTTLFHKVTNMTQKGWIKLREDGQEIGQEIQQNRMWREIFGTNNNNNNNNKTDESTMSLTGTEMVPSPNNHQQKESLYEAPKQPPFTNIRLADNNPNKKGPGLPRPSPPHSPTSRRSRTNNHNNDTEHVSLLVSSSSASSLANSSRASSPTMGQWCSLANTTSTTNNNNNNNNNNDHHHILEEPMLVVKEDLSRIKKPKKQYMTDRQSPLLLLDTDEEDTDSSVVSNTNTHEGIKKRTVSSNPDLLSKQFYGATPKPDHDDKMSSSIHSHSAFSPISSTNNKQAGQDEDEANLNHHRKKKSPSSSSVRASLKRPPVVFKEDWKSKEERIRSKSAFGKHPKWRLLPVLIKSNDDLRQEQLASQLIHQMATILAHAKSPAWLYPYEIIAIADNGGIMEAIPDTISIDSLKRNDKNFTTLKDFFERHFGTPGCDEHANAKANFVESLAAYSIVCFLLQVKDRHNGNILLDNKGHLIHIDFGFFFLSSPGKNSGFESAPFKLTRDFVDLMDGPDSATFKKFREICYRTFLELRKNCYPITILVEMLMEGNEDLACFRGRPQDAVRGLQERFRLDLNDRACMDYVNSLINESLENWRTRWYDRYQRFCVGVM